MKRLLIIVLFLGSLCCGAQSRFTPLQFKGIPIDGNYDIFANKLVSKGFKKQFVNSDCIQLVGPFLADTNVVVTVYSKLDTPTIESVMAIIPTGRMWSSIERRYNEIIDAYITKYGRPAVKREEIDGDAPLDFMKAFCLRSGELHYYCIWYLEGGRITVSMSYLDDTECITCSYVNDIPSKSYKEKLINDI